MTLNEKSIRSGGEYVGVVKIGSVHGDVSEGD
jgi:hypothetical protein